MKKLIATSCLVVSLLNCTNALSQGIDPNPEHGLGGLPEDVNSTLSYHKFQCADSITYFFGEPLTEQVAIRRFEHKSVALVTLKGKPSYELVSAGTVEFSMTKMDEFTYEFKDLVNNVVLYCE